MVVRRVGGCMMGHGRKLCPRYAEAEVLTTCSEWAQRVKPEENLIFKKE
jgi:hypothetical protein